MGHRKLEMKTRIHDQAVLCATKEEEERRKRKLPVRI